MARLDRDDLIQGLRQLIVALREAGEPAGIRIVGGAALSLMYFERGTTNDIDAKIHPAAAALASAAAIAERNDWAPDWLNSSAVGFIPFSAEATWHSLYEEDGIGIWVASPEVLLVMKLKASRPGRDEDDIARLLVLCGVATVAEAEEVYERYYLGEALEEKAYRMLDQIFSVGLPPAPARPDPPQLG